MIRLIKAIGLLSLLAFCLSSGAFGYFSSRAVSPENNITTGMLYIGRDSSNKGVLDGALNLSKMLPGEPPMEFKLTVRNVGDVKAYLNGLSASIKENDDKFMANAVRVTCTGSGGEKLYSGSLLSLDGSAVPTSCEITMEPDEEVALTFTFQLDARAGNAYKGRKIGASLTVFAGQVQGQKLETKVVAAGSDIQNAVDTAAPGSVILVSAGSYGRVQIDRSDVMVKAGDVVFDTVLSGVAFTGQAREAMLQGFTLGGRDNQGTVLSVSDTAKNLTVSDNVIQGETMPGDLIIGSRAGLDLVRNDFGVSETGQKQESSPGI